MANWTGLAGFAGLAAALENIQDRRVKEAELQRKMTEGKGEWAPMTGGGGGFLGGLDQFLGYNKPGQMGFGGQRYQFTPYAPMTEADVRGMGLTIPQTTTTPAYDKPWPTTPGGELAFGPPERVPEQEVTKEVPLPGFVGTILDPKTKQAIALERFKEHRDLAKLREEYRLAGAGLTPGSEGGGATKTQAFVVPGTEGSAATGGAATPAAPPAATPAAALASGPVPGIEKLSPQFRAKAQLIANRLGVNLDDFYRVMHFETGGEFSPATKNRMGSGATGLIQFTKRTAERLGTTTEALAQMTPEQQLDYVEKYLAPHKGKLGNLKDLYLSILYPAAMGKSDETVLFTPDKNPLEYRQNAGLDTDNKGYVTVRDAVAAVQRTTGVTPSTVPAQAPATGTAQAPAVPKAQALAGAPPAAQAATDPATQTYVTQFQKGSEADALKTITDAENKANPKNPADQATLLAMKRALETVFPKGQAVVSAAGGTGMQVAGPAAPGPQAAVPPTTTTVTPPAAPAPTTTGVQPPPQPTATYTPSPELLQQVKNNEQKIAANDERMNRIEINRRMAEVQTRKGMPGAVDRLRMYSEQWAALDKENKALNKESEDAYAKEKGLWDTEQKTRRGKAEDVPIKIAEETRKPPLEAEVTTRVQDASMTEDLRNTKTDLVAQGLAPEKDWKDYTVQEKATVTREHVARTKEFQLLENMDPWERSALYEITKRDKTPMGQASQPQLREARLEGRKQQLAHGRDTKIMESEAALDSVMGEQDALKWIDPVSRQPATNMTPRQAKEQGYILAGKPQQDTLRSGYNSIRYMDRMHVLYFGGEDKDGSITGQAGKSFQGIYPWIEAQRNNPQNIGNRAAQTLAIRTGRLGGQTLAQWAEVADNFISASLGAISRDMGGERGHFTDFDAERTRKYFANFGTKWWGRMLGDPNIMTSSGEAQKMMRLATGVITDRVRGALDLDPGDPLPWKVSGELLPKALPPEQRRQRGAPPAAGGTTPAAAASPVPTAGQEPAPVQPATQEAAPAQPGATAATGTAPKLDGPTAQRLLNDATKELFPGRAATSLTDEEVAQARARARAMWQQQQGGT